MNINLKSTLFYLFICTIFCNCTTFTGEQIEKTFDIDNYYTELQIEDAINVIISNEQDQISIITTENLINDVVIEKIDKYDNLEIGEVLAYNYDGKIIVHRIINIIEEDGNYYFYTKGDNNNSEDNFAVYEDMIVGVVNIRLPFIGYPTVWFN